jgi:hypothetical protein
LLSAGGVGEQRLSLEGFNSNNEVTEVLGFQADGFIGISTSFPSERIHMVGNNYVEGELLLGPSALNFKANEAQEQRFKIGVSRDHYHGRLNHSTPFEDDFVKFRQTVRQDSLVDLGIFDAQHCGWDPDLNGKGIGGRKCMEEHDPRLIISSDGRFVSLNSPIMPYPSLMKTPALNPEQLAANYLFAQTRTVTPDIGIGVLQPVEDFHVNGTTYIESAMILRATSNYTLFPRSDETLYRMGPHVSKWSLNFHPQQFQDAFQGEVLIAMNDMLMALPRHTGSEYWENIDWTRNFVSTVLEAAKANLKMMMTDAFYKTVFPPQKILHNGQEKGVGQLFMDEKDYYASASEECTGEAKAECTGSTFQYSSERNPRAPAYLNVPLHMDPAGKISFGNMKDISKGLRDISLHVDASSWRTNYSISASGDVRYDDGHLRIYDYWGIPAMSITPNGTLYFAEVKNPCSAPRSPFTPCAGRFLGVGVSNPVEKLHLSGSFFI